MSKGRDRTISRRSDGSWENKRNDADDRSARGTDLPRDGAGDFRAPNVLAVSPSGALLAVYDLGHTAIELFDENLNFIRRRVVDPPFVYPKDMLIMDDTTIVVSGGRVVTEGPSPGVHWLLPSGASGSSTPPGARWRW